jgi:general L-amino acid transport system permease protein
MRRLLTYQGVEVWRHTKVIQWTLQFVSGILVVVLVAWFFTNIATAVQDREIPHGFGFLDREYQTPIGHHFLDYESSDYFGYALGIAAVNTIVVSIVGVILATMLGIVIGVARLSSNWLVVRLASLYVETVRNVPLLLQLFFWYTVITGLLPSVRQAMQLLPGVYLSKSGLMFPAPVPHAGHPYMAAAFVIGCGLAWGYRGRARRHQEATGQVPRLLLPSLGLILGPPLLVWLVSGAPTALDVPVFTRFSFRGGGSITPEFLSLLAGLVLYTAAFIAENVRGGIQAVPRGQSEAAAALGLRRTTALRLVILPQALRIVIPPTTSQYLNLMKNSSLAVAIGYPDLVSVANTSLNQSGQAIECISIMMGVYLTISLSISAVMNVYDRTVALVER